MRISDWSSDVCSSDLDNGIGIARIHQAQIFEEFFQLGSGEPRQKRRLGLGLPICARIATLLGTRIELRSGLGRGSSFTIELPRAAPGVAAAAPGARSEERRVGKGGCRTGVSRGSPLH